MGGGPCLIIKHPKHRKQVSRPRHLMTCLLSFYVVRSLSRGVRYFLRHWHIFWYARYLHLWTVWQHKLISDTVTVISLDQRCAVILQEMRYVHFPTPDTACEVIVMADGGYQDTGGAWTRRNSQSVIKFARSVGNMSAYFHSWNQNCAREFMS